MGGKNRAKKLEVARSAGGARSRSTSTKKASSVKVGNKAANKRAKQANQAKDSESRSKGAAEKRGLAKGAKVRTDDGMNAEERKAAKRRTGGGRTGAPSVKQRKQHAHEPRGMSKHDEAYNARQQAKADRAAGREAGDKAEAEDESDSEPEYSEADAAFFEANPSLTGFLDNFNADDLNWSKEQRNQPKPRFPQPQPKDKAALGSEDEEDEDSEDDSDDDVESDDEEDDVESKPRVPSWAGAQGAGGMKDRLPIRNPDGSWGVSEISKYDALRARAAALERNQALASKAEAQASAQESAQDAEMLNDDAEASGDEEDEEAAQMEDDAEEEEEDDVYDDDLLQDEDDDDDLDAELEMEDVPAQAPRTSKPSKPSAPSIDAKELEARRQFRLKCELAENSELILENPEKHIGKLEPMLQLCGDADSSLQQLALMSCVEVLVDLMPTYRIRMPSEEELQANLSREVRNTWKYERSYLLYYGRLITHILSSIKATFTPQTNDRVVVAPVAFNLLRCACKLLEKGHAFNYRKELLSSLTPFLNHGAPRVRQLLFRTLVEIFRADVSGDSTLEAIRILARLIKDKGARVHVEVMQLWLHLPLHREILAAKTDDDKKRAPFKGKKQKAGLKVDEKELGRDLAESEATVSLATRKKIQTALLTELFTAYFRILKQQRNSRLLPVVLQGLAKFAPLIDIELVLDLLDCLKRTISPDAEQPLSMESTLYCILTSFQTLQSHGQALSLDLKEFYNCLYALLWQLCDPAEVVHTPLLLQCLQLMFHDTKQLSVERVASFVKRLCSVALYVAPYASLSIMHAVRLCLNKYPKVKQLLDREATASGMHLAEMDDPDLANSFASTAWELALLKASYHPFLPVYASSILEDEHLPLALQRTTPLQLFEAYDSSEGGFNPPMPPPSGLLGGVAAGGATSATMRKKLDLKRRMLVAQLAVQQRSKGLMSPFLKRVMEEAREGEAQEQQQREEQTEELKQRLQRLQAIAQQYRQQQQATPAKSKQQKKRPQPSAAAGQNGRARAPSAKKLKR